MTYQIKYLKCANLCIYDINGYTVRFKTKSNIEVQSYLEEAEGILINNKRFGSLEDIQSDKFRAIEYFSLVHPELVENYFLQVESELKSLLRGKNKKPSKQMAIGFISNIPIDNCLTKNNPQIVSVLQRISAIMKATTAILNNIYFSLNRIDPEVKKSYNTIFGELTCCGRKFKSPLSLWGLNGYTYPIFRGDEKSIDEQSKLIIEKLTEVHTKLKSNIVTELIDFTQLDDIKMFNLYIKSHRDLVRGYIENIIENNISNGILLRKSGYTDGFCNINIIQTISKNKDRRLIDCYRGSQDNNEINLILNKLINEYLIKQVDLRIENNSFNISENRWIYYFIVNGKLKFMSFDFSQLENGSVKTEFMLYVKYLLDRESQTKNTLREHKKISYQLGWYIYVRASLDYFIEEFSINNFADIEPGMITSYLEDLLLSGINNRLKKTISTIGNTIFSMKSYSKWIYRNAEKISTVKPSTNLFQRVEFHGASEAKRVQKDTFVIPDFVIDQLQKKLHYLKPEVYRRILFCLLNTPRRFNELQLLHIGSVNPLFKNGKQVLDEMNKPVYKLEFVEHKKHRNKEINNNGLNYDKIRKTVIINHIVAREIEIQTEETKQIEKEINSIRPDNEKINIDKVFVVKDETMKEGYALLDTNIFVDAINSFIKASGIVDYEGYLWNFASKQTRETGASILVANGSELDIIQEQLAHERSATTYNSYIRLSHLQLAQENTEFIKSEFDLLFSEHKDKFDEFEQLAIFNKYCIDYNKIYYNRKLLGVCGLSIGEKCPYGERDKKNLEKDEMPCADCPSLYVGLKCKSGWEEICLQCKNDMDIFEEFFQDNNIFKEDAIKVKEYKTAFVKYIKSKLVLEAISKIGD